MAIQYSILQGDWDHSNRDVKMHGDKYRVDHPTETDDWTPPKELQIGMISTHASKESKAEDADAVVTIGGKSHIVREYKKGNITARNVGWAPVVVSNGRGGGSSVRGASGSGSAQGSSLAGRRDVRYVMVRKTNVLFWIILLIALVALFFVLFKAITGVSPQDVPRYVGQKAGVVDDEAEGELTITSYSSYQSVPDQTWNAGTTTQSCTLALPAKVSYTNSDGEEVTEDNPVDAAAHIYVDLNGDGDFSEDECVYNPITYDSDGNITALGDMIRAGYQLDTITLTRTLPAGTYDAECVWTGMVRETGELANPMVFLFKVTVR